MVRLELGDQAAASKLAPVTAVYDASGLAEMRQGDQVVHYERDAAGRPTRGRRGGRRARRVRLRRGRPVDGAALSGRAHLRLRIRRRRRADSRARSRPRKSHVFTPTGWKQYISAWTPPGGAGAYSGRARRRRGSQVGDLPERGGAHRRRPMRAGACAGSPFRAPRAPSATRRARTASRPTTSTAAPGGAAQGLSAQTDGMQLTTLTATGLAPAVTTFAYGATKLDVTSVDLDVPGDGSSGAGAHARRGRRPDRVRGLHLRAQRPRQEPVGDHRRHGAHGRDDRRGRRPQDAGAEGRRRRAVPARARHRRHRPDRRAAAR